MTLPGVTLTQLDGALGIQSSGRGKLLAVVGTSSIGTADQPASYAKITDLVAAFGYGPLVEAAAHAIRLFGKPVLCVKTAAASTIGAFGAITQPATGTATVTATAGAEPFDDYEVQIEVVLGGTVGTGPIHLRHSLDGGRNWSATVNIGTDLAYAIADTGVSVDLSIGDTLVTGDLIDFLTSAPQYDNTELTAALTALQASSAAWETLHLTGEIDATFFDTADAFMASMATAGKYRNWVGNTRMPNAGETEAAYKTALDTIFSAKASTYGGLCAGAAKVLSAVSGRKYRRPISFHVAPYAHSVSEEVNIADINLGAMPVDIRDANGNIDEHDEANNPGLDDSRFITLRTWGDDVQGVYVTRPRIFSASGSDFYLIPHRRVMNIALAALRAYFIRRANKEVQVDQATGYILEEDALEIEAGAKEIMRSVLLAKPKASAVQFALSRTDNLLSTLTFTGTARVIPLAYPEFIELEVGFLNPALAVVPVAA